MKIKQLLSTLISYESVTPNDSGCQMYMMNYLTHLGFRCQRFDKSPVSNFFAHYGSQSPMLMFAGHTDVVPPGDLQQWKTKPFSLHEDNGTLYGRGTADMKGSLACMLLAATRFVKEYPAPKGGIAFLITSGEEGDDFDRGTPYVMDQLDKRGIRPQYCIVGEPSSTHKVGDVVKIGRRGSLTGKLVLKGKQGHVAYPHLADNPIHKILPALQALTAKKWDEGNEHFPPTSLQLTQIKAGGEAGNIIPGEIHMDFNFRYSTEQTADLLKLGVTQCFADFGITPSIHWRLNGEPFLTSNGVLLEACLEVLTHHLGVTPELSTSGGTSDGRFIAPYGIETLELGPVNATIHQVNECVSLEDLNTLTQIYYEISKKLCG
jgi:succinyl-diaminopimelate desuccinylase